MNLIKDMKFELSLRGNFFRPVITYDSKITLILLKLVLFPQNLYRYKINNNSYKYFYSALIVS